MSEAASNGDSPYVGLIPYTEGEAQLFFGRERERDIINANLLGARLTVLYGLTGAGKTSILRAGVEHHLKLLARENRERFGKPELAIVVFSAWKGDPLDNLRQEIKKSVEWALGAEGGVEEPSAKGLSDTLKQYAKLVNGEILIILDQFEEYFLYHRRSDDTDFSEEFARAVNRASSHASFLISIREDALAKLDHFKGKISGLFSNYLRIEHLTSKAARDAIRRPLDIFSEMTHAEPRFTIEDELVDEVCRQVRVKANKESVADEGPDAARADSDSSKVETSFLQLVMTKLWEDKLSQKTHRLSLETLKKLGGADTIVQEHLNFNLIGFPEEEQEAAAAIFHYLVTPSGTKVAYTASDLAQQTYLPRERVETVLEKLCAVDKRILRSYYIDRARQDVKSYEIYHDVLANAILGWSAWYQRDQERRRLEREANALREADARRKREEEEERQREEQAEAEQLLRRMRRRRRVRMWVLGVAFFITLVSAILMIYAKEQERKAQAAAREADEQRAKAQSLLETVDSIDEGVAFFKAVMRGHKEPVLGVDFSPDQTRIVTASDDATARVWDIGDKHARSAVATLTGHASAVRSARFSPDGKLIATASDDRTARVWEAATGQLLHVLAGHEKEVSAARFSRDSRLIVTASTDGTARIWEAATGRQDAVLHVPTGAVTYADFSPDGKLVVTGDSEGAVQVWDVGTGAFTFFGAHASAVNTAVFSPSGRMVVTASSDGEARLWNVSGGQSFALKGHSGPVNSAAFSPDETLVVTASDDRTARVWDVRTHQPTKVLEGHTDAVLGAAFSDDSGRVITASADRTARVWEAGSGRVLFELRGHADMVNQAIFSPLGGRLAATASADKTARVWDIGSEGGKGGIRIIDVAVSLDPETYNGPCPVGVTISGSITVAGSGTIAYRFARSDGYIGPEKTLNFESSSTKEVTTTWLFGARPSRSFSGNVQLEITSGQSFPRKEAVYEIKCTPRSAVTPTPTATPTPTPTPAPPAPTAGPG